MVLMNCFVSSMVERDESSWLRMANLPAVLASYWPLLAALWVLDVFSYLWESADIRSAEDGNNY